MVNGQNPLDFTAARCVDCLPAIFDSRPSCAAIVSQVQISLAEGREEFVKFGFQLFDSRLLRGVKGKTLRLDRYC